MPPKRRVTLAPAVGCEISYRCSVAISDAERIRELGKSSETKKIFGKIEAFLGGDLWRCYFGRDVGIKNLSSTVFTVIKPPDFTKSRLNPSSLSLCSSTESSTLHSPPRKKADRKDFPVHCSVAAASNDGKAAKDPPGHSSSIDSPPCAANRWGLGALPVQLKLTDMSRDQPDKYNFDRSSNSRLSNWTPGFAEAEHSSREYWKQTRKLAAERADARAAKKIDKAVNGPPHQVQNVPAVAALPCQRVIGYHNEDDGLAVHPNVARITQPTQGSDVDIPSEDTDPFYGERRKATFCKIIKHKSSKKKKSSRLIASRTGCRGDSTRYQHDDDDDDQPNKANLKDDASESTLSDDEERKSSDDDEIQDVDPDESCMVFDQNNRTMQAPSESMTWISSSSDDFLSSSSDNVDSLASSLRLALLG